MPLLTQNSDLKPHHIFNWTIPAWYIRREDGSIFKTCPNAGICAKLCYARNGTYLFSNVLKAHTRNLMFVLENETGWFDAMNTELKSKRMKPKQPRLLPDGLSLDDLDPWMRSWFESGHPAIRIHDAGDFYDEHYLRLWIKLAEENPQLLFYAYTKEVAMFKAFGVFPINFRYLFSTGGLQDDLITADDRHADVFPTLDAMIQANYSSQDASDLLAIMLPTNRIGITANNIPHFNKKLAGKTFSEYGKKNNATTN